MGINSPGQYKAGDHRVVFPVLVSVIITRGEAGSHKHQPLTRPLLLPARSLMGTNGTDVGRGGGVTPSVDKHR